jgi:hypothetical protein
MARLARPWDCPEPPEPFAGLRIVSIKQASDPRFSSAYPDNYFAINCEWRNGNRISKQVDAYHRIPSDRPGLCIKRDEMTIKGADKDRAI